MLLVLAAGVRLRVLLIGSEPNGLSPPGNRHHPGSAALGTKSS
jgi:hypothetical protein